MQNFQNYILTALIGFLSTLTFCERPATGPVEDEYRRRLEQAAAAGRKLLIVFGADWCADCRAFEARLKEEPLRGFMNENYVVLKVDVCRYDCNMDFAAKFGNPVDQGIPALVIVDGTGRRLAATNNGEFASARSMPARAMLAYFQKFAGTKESTR